MLDLNHNGIPDYKEPKVWLWLGRFISKVVLMFAASHTVAHRAASNYMEATEAFTKTLSEGEGPYND